MNETVFNALTLIIPLVFAIVFHEVAHGWMARALGDHTAERMNRLSLNPLRHVDPIGTVILPGMLALMKAPVFGWAKPVPVVKERLRNPRTGMMAVAAAGPGSNLLLAAIGAVMMGIAVRIWGGTELGMIGKFLVANLNNFILINVFLALFNLLPVPPFDGSHIVEGLLPPALAERYAALRPFGFPIMLVLLIGLPWLIPGFDPVGQIVMPPFEWVTGGYFELARAVAGR